MPPAAPRQVRDRPPALIAVAASLIEPQIDVEKHELAEFEVSEEEVEVPM
ncbi:MAG: hypothetical protein R6V58_04635 [Planctomycetota bacterium]